MKFLIGAWALSCATFLLAPAGATTSTAQQTNPSPSSFGSLFQPTVDADPRSFQFIAFNFPEGGEKVQLGSPASEFGRSDDETLHTVTLTKSFEMQATPVTEFEWKKVMGFDPSHFNPHRIARANRPVEEVSWNDAQKFIKKLNRMDRRYTYRLPTEAEWEYAARAHTTTAYSFGSDPDQGRQYVIYAYNCGSTTHEVAGVSPNPAGLYDMLGNVLEWCQDWYGAYPINSVDPTGPSSGLARIMRGAPMCEGPVRSARRGYGSPMDYRFLDVGFRLVRTLN